MKTKNTIITLILICILLSLSLSLAGCNSQTEMDLSKAHNLLEKIYTNTKIQSQSFDKITTEEELLKWCQDEYGIYLTEEGLDTAIKNRVITRGINEYKSSGKEFKVNQIDINERSGDSTGTWYNFTIELLDENNATKKINGTLEMAKKQNEWFVNSITITR